MSAPRVLQIGIDPSVVDFAPWPGQSAATLRARLAQVEADLRGAGFEVTVCAVPDDADLAEAQVRRFLTADAFDVIEIGSGLRTAPEYTEIFERVVTASHALQPGVPLCFNDGPESTLATVQRALNRGGA
ncbi:hypothetical protein [Microbacterium gorillae]|uniref:hypothetical protein n=1 Tax=Microbacterium gorillae TaxID=1231063 RepID=UPI0005905EC0|nr:hypothetical protein [Microbacterium gorillae]